MPTSPWAADPRGRAPRTSSNSGRRSASTSRGPNRTRSCSRTRCWARARTDTATSSTSARPSPDGCRPRACISMSIGAAASCSGWRTTCRSACSHDEVTPTCVGHIVGLRAGTDVPVIVGLPADTGEDRLKALGAAAASSGAVAMFHAVGITPEAATLDDALGGNAAKREVVITRDLLRAARDELTTVEGGAIAAVSVGTPHMSTAELGRPRGGRPGPSTRRSRSTRTPAARSPPPRARSRTWPRPGSRS